MRDSGWKGIAGGFVIVTAGAFYGCAQQPHNNVLIFGTDTKFALDVSSSAAQGGAPEVTLGYKRREAVWLPLSNNEYECENKDEEAISYRCDVTATTVKFTGASEGINEELGGKEKEEDAYSVFASFGADFGGEADATGSKASGGLAQFFATGIAAQRLGANPQVTTALAVKSVAESDLDAAKKEVSDAKDEAAKAQQLSEELTSQLNAKQEKKGAEINLVLACANLETSDSKADALVAQAKTDGGNAAVLDSLKNNPKKDYWIATMQVDSAVRKFLVGAYGTVCP